MWHTPPPPKACDIFPAFPRREAPCPASPVHSHAAHAPPSSFRLPPRRAPPDRSLIGPARPPPPAPAQPSATRNARWRILSAPATSHSMSSRTSALPPEPPRDPYTCGRRPSCVAECSARQGPIQTSYVTVCRPSPRRDSAPNPRIDVNQPAQCRPTPEHHKRSTVLHLDASCTAPRLVRSPAPSPFASPPSAAQRYSSSTDHRYRVQAASMAYRPAAGCPFHVLELESRGPF